MKETVLFLIQNPDVLEKVKSGYASLVGVSSKELQVILEVFNNSNPIQMDYWM